jgi:hypothetical protein
MRTAVVYGSPLVLGAVLALACARPDAGVRDIRRRPGSSPLMRDRALLWTTDSDLVFQRVAVETLGGTERVECDSTGVYTVRLGSSDPRPVRLGAPLCDVLWQAERPALSRDTQVLVYANTFRGGRIEAFDLTNGTVTPLVAVCVALNNAPAWAPEGRRIAFSADCSPEGPAHPFIHLMSPDGSDVRPVGIPNRGIVESSPAWAPAGGRIALTRARIPWQFQVVVLDTLTARRTVIARGFAPAWSRTTNWIAYVSYDGRIGSLPSIRIVRPDGTGDHALISRLERSEKALGQAPKVESWPLVPLAWSANGETLAFSRGSAIWVISLNGDHLRPLIQGKE